MRWSESKMPELTLGAALEGLGVKADEVLASRVYEDRIVIVLTSGPKLTWPPSEPAMPVPELPPGVKASDEARRVAVDLDVDLKEVEASRESGKISSKDVRLTAGERKRGKG